MKTPKLILLIFIFLSLSLSSLFSQVVNDPITNIYKVGGSSEVFVAYSTSGNSFTRQGVMDIDENLNAITKKEDALQFKFMDYRKNAAAKGDFNGDGADEVVCLRDNVSGGIKIAIPLIGQDLIMNGQKEYIIDDLNSLNYERLRVCSGNFDQDPQMEFVICYGAPTKTIGILLFETDSALNIKLVDSFKEIVYYDYNFDISAGDINGDGIDEIVLVKNKAGLTVSGNPAVFKSTYDLNVLEYDPIKKSLEWNNKKEDIILNNTAAGGYYNAGLINEMRVTCGDLNIDGKDEIVVGWSNYYCFGTSYHCTLYVIGCWEGHTNYYFRSTVFLNTFRLSQTSEIENVQNTYVTHSDFGERNWVNGQQIALTLKCEQMDNLGRDEVLINGANRFCVLGSGDEGMGLRKKVDLAALGGNLNIRGTESFVVADLNPDTATMNFNKEVVLLLSDKNHEAQMGIPNDIPKFEILMIDTISADTIAFVPPVAAHDFPFNDQDIEISAFLTGDFDLKNTDVYFVGIPDVIPVSDIQQPLIILNAPPVHFDVINGVNYDICNAFNSVGFPDFYAKYNTKVENENTTSVAVKSAMGFSNELKAYAMAGGSGFESTVKTNFEMGREFYQANSQNKIIEEEKSVYTEDYVLYSSLDYTYYRYPVYNNDREKIGKIAVLNPKSQNFTTVWGSANTWEHPAYIFNHEPGNILSYKSCKNSADICHQASPFTSCEFSRVPVTNTGNGNFKFTYENISSAGNSFSFSSGVGVDFFTKIGVEGTATVELAPFGLGGSISTDFKIGVSNELSMFFSSSAMSTHNTELKKSFQVDGNIGRLEANFDNVARYFITPYIYRSQSGALVLDYMVELDSNNKDWWVANYGQKPDLAFILPWRYAKEKGSENITRSKMQRTNEIQFINAIAKPGDTVCIATRVHNYSLKTFNDNLKVDYYLGDPGMGGVKLTDINGTAGSSKNSTMIYGAEDANMDFEEYLIFNWQVPDTVSCSPRIYAVIDPENEFEEIHENNNIGWNVLHIYDCLECLYAENTTSLEKPVSNQVMFEAYPNPFSSYFMIRFTLANPESVTIDLFDMSGQKVRTVADQKYLPGGQEITVNAQDLGAGLYYCKITAGNFNETKKLILVK